MSAFSEQDFYTDKQLRERWHCSHMKLYRLRAEGILPPPIKIGGRARTLRQPKQSSISNKPHSTRRLVMPVNAKAPDEALQTEAVGR